MKIPENASLYLVGKIESIVNDLVVIRSMPLQLDVSETNVKVLETDTILVLEDKRVIGRIFEVLGPVVLPIYSIRFNKPEDIVIGNFEVGMQVFGVKELSSFVSTEEIKKIKGSDASNMYDEEVRGEEIDFSDDEAEQDWKRSKRGQSSKKPPVVSSDASESWYVFSVLMYPGNRVRQQDF